MAAATWRRAAEQRHETEATLREVEPAARTMGLQIQVFNANTRREIGAAFESM